MADELVRIDSEEPNRWLAEVKHDGWRSQLYVGDSGRAERLSKYETGEQTQRPPDELMDAFDAMGFPAGSAFDGEWMGRRCVKDLKGRHFFCVWDLLYWNWTWLGNKPLTERRLLLAEVFDQGQKRSDTGKVVLIPQTFSGFYAFFNANQTNPLLEGVVLKRRDSLLLGTQANKGVNPDWLKAKWR
jgi:ATP-dependent DNA ligase